MKKIICVFFVIFLMTISIGVVYAEDEITIKYNNTKITFNEKSIVMNERTLVQLRPIAEALDLGIEYDLDSCSVILSNADSVVEFKQNSNIVNINDVEYVMDVPMIIHNDYSFVPVRDLVEPFGNEIEYDALTKTVTITPKTSITEDEFKRPEENQTEEIEDDSVIPSDDNTVYNYAFFYQAQPEFQFENGGRGYCWVCSYAMLFSSVSEEIITPLDITNYNIENGYEGNFMAGHETLAEYFGLELVPALSEDSQFFGGFNLKSRGETSLKITTDEDVKNALREALDNFPGGIIVRYEGYPHTMMAISYDENNIYFNDPAVSSGENLLFEETCLKNFVLSDISYIQAVR